MTAKEPGWLRKTWTYCATLKFVEGVSVAVVFMVGLYVLVFLVFVGVESPTRQRMVELVRLISDNWKAFLLLLVPMFYRTIRTFIEEVQEIASVKRKTHPQGEPSKAENPPGGPGVP